MAHETHNHHQQDKHGTLMASGFGGGYSDFSASPSVQSFEQAGSAAQELLGLQAGMEMLGFPSRPRDHHHNPASSLWRAFKPGDFPDTAADNLMAASSSSSSWQQQQQPSQGLSLSLCNADNPSDADAVALQQSFHLSSNPRHDFLAKSIHLQQQQLVFQDGIRFFPPSPLPPAGISQQLHQLSNSKYLAAAQDLLNEFVNMGVECSSSKPSKPKKPSQWEEESHHQSLYSLDLLELQKRKAKLLSMLEEVDRRYRKYCEQMQAVVSTFEVVAGEGAAMVYSRLASKAMSRHFRCLRDGIVGQIQATRKAMGEKDPVAPGTTRGETPRLRLIDQCLRQHKAFQQAGMMESHPWRPQRGLPERSVSVLRAWLFEHFLHPYPSDVDKHILARQTGLSRSQVSNWFINARVRLWKPMVEEMYMEELKEGENQQSSSTAGNEDASGRQSHLQPHYVTTNPNPNPTASQLRAEDQKPTLDQLLHVESDSLSSIIHTGHHRSDHRDIMNSKDIQQQNIESFGVVDEMDFSNSYGGGQGFGGSGVSLTLGLQQHDGGGVSLAFSPTAAAAQQSFFYARQQIEDCQPGVQFSILEGEAQNLPYRNLMGAQLLHDLAG